MKYTMSLKRKIRDLTLFDFDKALDVMRLKNQGYNFTQISKELGISKQRVAQIWHQVSTMTVAEAEVARRIVEQSKLPIDNG